MPDPSEVVDRLRADTAAYDAAAKREGEVWGKQFSSEQQKEMRADDQVAAARLRPARFAKNWAAVARAEKWHFTSGLSLACGSGRAERHLMKIGVCDQFVGIDVAEAAIAEARTVAASEKLAISYEVADLNKADLGVGRYDLVVTQNCLHHVLELEHLAEQIWQCLLPGGKLWIDDFIGETQFQWTDRRLDLANRVLALLPERYRRFRMHGRVMDAVVRRPPGSLISPFEAIRSAEIVPVFSKWFDIELRNEYNAIMQLVCPVGARQNYLETEDGATIFKLLMLLDHILTEHGIVPPLAGQFVMSRREQIAGE